MKSFSFEAIGTAWAIDILDTLSEENTEHLRSDIVSRVEEFDRTFSRFRHESLVTQMAHQPGEYILPADGVAMLTIFRELYDLTAGAFTPFIGSLLEQAGYDASYTLKPKRLRPVHSWDEIMAVSGARIFLREPALLDFGALGKGRLIDILAELFQDRKITSYCIDAGGDIRYTGAKPLRVGLEHPAHPEQVIGVVKMKNQSIAASAGNRRKWKQFHHIMHPKTRKPVTEVLATWVLADDAMTADALATALFLTTPETLEGRFSYTYLIVYPDYSLKMSEDFPAELYYNNS